MSILYRLCGFQRTQERERPATVHKRGQITVFVILGIVIIFAVSTYLYLRQKGASLEESISPSTKEIPFELQPLNSYIETCIAQIAVEGLEKLGQRGGYIEPQNQGITANPAAPTDAEGVQFAPGSEPLVPYWYYMKSDNKCEGYCAFSYQRPRLYRSQGEPSIEGQLDDYMDKNLEQCLGNLDFFKRQGFLVEKTGPLRTQTTVYEEDVGFYVEYPLTVTKDNRVHTLDKFLIRVPVNLRAVYDQASVITNLQAHYKFLEKDLLNLIVGYSRVDPKKLPPMAATGFDFSGGTRWSKLNVKDDVEGILLKDIPSLQVYGSLNYNPVSFPGNYLRETLYNSGMLVVSNQTYPNLEVNFNYLDFWPIYFDLNCPGEICQPESASSNLLTLIGIQRYNFLYDLSFPVLVSVSQPSALNNKGYEFQFMLEGNIRDNEPVNDTFIPLVSAFVADSSMLCDLDKRNSGNVSIKVVNAFDKKPLDEVDVAYSCIEENCPMGKTENGMLQTPFPICMGGIVEFFKDGFLASSKWLTTELDKDSVVEVELMPLTPFNFSIWKYPLVKAGEEWVMRDNPIPLDDNEQAMLNIRRIGSLGESEYSVTREYYGNESSQEIELAPGNYMISLQISLNENIVIWPQKRCQSTTYKKTCFYVPTNVTTVEKPVPVGGLNMNYSFSIEDMQKKEIIFYGYTADLAGVPEKDRVIEDLEPTGKIDEYSVGYQNTFAPRFE